MDEIIEGRAIVHNTHEWATLNPVLEANQLGYDFVLHELKLGDGINHWSDLQKIKVTVTEVEEAPKDGKAYVREKGKWVKLTDVDVKQVYYDQNETIINTFDMPSYDWTVKKSPVNIDCISYPYISNNIIWVSELKCFLIATNNETCNLIKSFDGVNYTPFHQENIGSVQSVYYDDYYKIVILGCCADKKGCYIFDVSNGSFTKIGENTYTTNAPWNLNFTGANINGEYSLYMLVSPYYIHKYNTETKTFDYLFSLNQGNLQYVNNFSYSEKLGWNIFWSEKGSDIPLKKNSYYCLKCWDKSHLTTKSHFYPANVTSSELYYNSNEVSGKYCTSSIYNNTKPFYIKSLDCYAALLYIATPSASTLHYYDYDKGIILFTDLGENYRIYPTRWINTSVKYFNYIDEIQAFIIVTLDNAYLSHDLETWHCWKAPNIIDWINVHSSAYSPELKRLAIVSNNICGYFDTSSYSQSTGQVSVITSDDTTITMCHKYPEQGVHGWRYIDEQTGEEVSNIRANIIMNSMEIFNIPQENVRTNSIRFNVGAAKCWYDEDEHFNISIASKEHIGSNNYVRHPAFYNYYYFGGEVDNFWMDKYKNYSLGSNSLVNKKHR